MKKLADALVEEIQRGRVVLLLGAGASLGATTPEGKDPPTGDQLRDALADRFLGGAYKDASLAWVSELAISETDLGTVQDYIGDLLSDLKPAAFQQPLATFPWRGLATTNYDLVVETIYRSGNRLQDLKPILSDRDKIDEILRKPTDLGFLKLHGCVTRTRDPEIPLILTVDQYVTHRQGRDRLFTTLREWGAQYPIVFIGHRGQDSDIRELLLDLSKAGDFRPRYYLVKPWH